MKKTIGLYIHIPFCKQKCFYCDFPSYAGKEAQQEAYVAALEAEIRKQGKRYPDKRVTSVFFGGGTPTVLPIPLLKRLMQAVWESWDIAEEAEVTTEANPGTLCRESAIALKEMGFNRLSMGVQAWQNRLLKILGRIHTIEDVQEMIRAVREAGFENLNVDLMFALPEQTVSDWQETVKAITALQPEHISAYSLILEEGTPFFTQYEKGLLEPASEELDREMYHWAVRYFREAGYQQYEISNFAKPGKESCHNQMYWKAEAYLGMGLGAHSYMEGMRFHNTYDLEEYIAANGELQKEDVEEITEADAMSEFLFLGLRLTEGVSYARFRERFQKELWEVYGTQIRKNQADGLLEADAVGIRLTPRGIDVSNVVFEQFLL